MSRSMRRMREAAEREVMQQLRDGQRETFPQTAPGAQALTASPNGVTPAGAVAPVTVIADPFRGEHLELTGTGVTIAGGGTDLFTVMDTIVEQHGFAAVTSAGTALSAWPAGAPGDIQVDVEWTDGHRGGGTVVLQVAGTADGAPWDDAGPWSQWSGSRSFVAAEDAAVAVTVTPSDATSHTANATMRVTIHDPLRVILTDAVLTQDTFLGVYDGFDPYLLRMPVGASTFATVPLPAATATAGDLISAIYVSASAIIVADTGSRIHRATVVPTVAGDWTLVDTMSDYPYGFATDGTTIAAMAGDYLLESTDDGVTWTETSGQTLDCRNLRYGGGLWVRWDDTDTAANEYQDSSDLSTWSTVTVDASTSANTTMDVGTDGTTMVRAAYKLGGTADTTDVWDSDNGGTTWSANDLSFGDATTNGSQMAFCVGTSRFVVSTDSSGAEVWRDTGAGWTEMTVTGTNYGAVGPYMPSVDVNGRIVVPLGSDSRVLVSDDAAGDAWTVTSYAGTVSGAEVVAAGAYS